MQELPSPFSVQERHRDDSVVMAVGGELDRAVAPQLEDLLRSHSHDGLRLVVDLRALEFIDSSGLAVLIRASADAARDGWEFAIVASNSSTVRHVFTVSGLEGQLPFVLPPDDGSGAPPPFAERYPATPTAIGAARHAVEAFVRDVAGLAELAGRAALAVSEACTNAVLHAYVDRDGPGAFEVTAAIVIEDSGPALRVTVADEGSGMMPRIDSPGVGMGLPIIAQITDRYEVRAPAAGGTELCMLFAVA